MTNETKILIGVLAATVVIIIGGAFIAGRGGGSTTSTQTVDTSRLVRSDDPVLGSTDAKVTIVEFGDFQCPACGALHPVLKQVKEANKDAAVRFVFRQFPLTQLHEHAQLAAEASLAAQEQGKFWEYHDQMYENQQNLTEDDLIKHAQAVGLDTAAFKQALDNGTYKDAVQQDVADGTALRVQGTPTIYINGVQYTGQYSVKDIQSVIDKDLAN